MVYEDNIFQPTKTPDMSKNIIRMVLPKLTPKRVWIGYYFNHYNAIVIYHTKPVKGTDDEYPERYDTLDNVNKIGGCLMLNEFKELFPSLDLSPIIDKKTNNVKHIETEILMEVTLVAPWHDNKLVSIDFNLDGY